MARNHVVVLLGLRWRLLLASFSGRAGRRVATILGLVVIAIWAFSFGATAYRMVQSTYDWPAASPVGARPALLRVVFLVTFLLQLMTGVAFLSVSDFFDTSRLLHLPVRARSVFVAMLISSVLSPSTLVFGAPAIGAVLALPGQAIPVWVHLLTVVGLVTFGQALALLLGYLLLMALSRRRLRDLATVVGSVIGLGSYALIRLFGPQASFRDLGSSAPLWNALGWSPTSWFSDLVSWDDAQRFSDPWSLGPPLLALGASLVLGAGVFSRFYERAGEGGQADRATRAAPGRGRVLPPTIGAVARQTSALIWREPQLRALLFQQMIFLLIPLFSLRSDRGAASAAMVSVPFVIVFSHAWMAMSLLGIDGGGLKLLLQSPASRTRILLGRALSVWRLFAVIDLVACGVLVSVMTLMNGMAEPIRRFAECATACLIADAVMVGSGAMVSVYFPSPLVRKSRSMRMRQEGCSTSIGKAVIRLPAIVVSVVIGLSAVLPAIAGLDPAWYLATVPGAVLVASAIAAAGIARGGRRLADSEERVVAELAEAGE